MSRDRIKYLTELLNNASKAYYQEDRQIMSDLEYDKLYDELVSLENETGFVMSQSPTNKVGFEVMGSLTKVAHETRILSLDKTKSVDKLEDFLADKTGILSWKLDGLTVVIKYTGGKLSMAVTRGNGEIGEDITHNAKVFKNIPLSIDFVDDITIRGEAVITFSEFEKINAGLKEGEFYKNPRNLTSGTVRQLNSEITAKRNVMFFAFTLITEKNTDFGDRKLAQLELLEKLGFDVVEHVCVNKNNIADTVAVFQQKTETNDFATDGLVLTYDSISYSQSLGVTSKFPKDSIAFKWKDEMQETVLTDVVWNTSRTGLINPIAVFSPVDIEGSTVSRASVHNVSILEELALGIGDTITVYKANMVIPQISQNLTKSGSCTIPDKCPVCSESTEIRMLNEGKALYCNNPNCRAQLLKSLTHYTSRDAMNIEGLSEATLEKFVESGYIENFNDLYELNKYEEQIVTTKGFGQKTFDNLMSSIERSRQTELHRLIYALGILNVGLSNAKLLTRHYQYDLKKIMAATQEELIEIEGFGEVIANSIVKYFSKDSNISLVENLCGRLNFVDKINNVNEQSNHLSGKTFVITGEVTLFKNRNTLKQKIEELSGKVTGSVTGKTSFLINNDINSNSGKNQTAKKIGVPIITEAQFVEMFIENNE